MTLLIGVRHHDRTSDTRQCDQRRFNGTGLNAEAAYLDAGIFAAKVGQAPAVVQATQIAGPELNTGSVWQLAKRRRSEIRLVPVPERKCRRLHDDLAYLARSNVVSVFIHQPQVDVRRDRIPNRHHIAVKCGVLPEIQHAGAFGFG